MRDHPVILLIKTQLIHTEALLSSTQGGVMQCASQEKRKDPDKRMQVARSVSVAERDTGRRVIYWD